MIADHEDELDKVYEVSFDLRNEFTSHFQKQLVSDATQIPVKQLSFDQPMTLYYRGKPVEPPKKDD